MSTFKRLSDALGISQSISNLISNTQSGIDSITEVYDALYDLNQNNITQISNLESQIIGLSYSFSSSGLSGSSGTSGSSGSSGLSGSSGTSGSTGSSGTSGSQGNKGGLQYTLENYGGGTPATGKFTFNASEGTAFDLRINVTDRIGTNNSGYFSQLVGRSGYIYITNNSNSIARAIVYPFTNVTLVSGYYLFGLDFNEGIDGTVLPPNDICALTIVINGVSGSSGSSGTSGLNGSSGINGSLNDSVIGGYLLSSNTQRPYKLTVGQVQSTSTTGTINGESIYGHKFYCTPGSVINEIAFRIMTAGASGLGLAACRILIYRTKLNASGNIVAGDLELDTNVNISTLTTGLKVVSGLNHTLSSNTYKDCWFMCIRNYQSGSLSLKLHSNTGTVTHYADISQSSTTYTRDMGWYFSCPYALATPASMPATSSTTPSINTVVEYSNYIMFGYSAT